MTDPRPQIATLVHDNTTHDVTPANVRSAINLSVDYSDEINALISTLDTRVSALERGGQTQTDPDILVLPDKTLYTQVGTPFTAYLQPFGAAGLGYVYNVDYTETATIHKSTFPNNYTITWNWPALASGVQPSIKAYLVIAYGDYYNTVSDVKVTPAQVRDIGTFTTNHNVTLDPSSFSNGYDVIHDFFLTQNPNDHSVHLFEFELACHVPQMFIDYFNISTFVGTVTISGVLWKVAYDNVFVPWTDILIMRNDNSDYLSGPFDWVALFTYLRNQGILTGNEYFNGTTIGTEISHNGGSVTINQFSVDYKPISLSLSNYWFLDNLASGGTIATISATNFGTGSNTYTIFSDPDNLFTITGNSLKLNGTTTEAASRSHSVTIKGDDGAGNIHYQRFRVGVIKASPTETNLITQQDLTTSSYWTLTGLNATASDTLMETSSSGSTISAVDSLYHGGFTRSAGVATYRVFADVTAIGLQFGYLQLYAGDFSSFGAQWFDIISGNLKLAAANIGTFTNVTPFAAPTGTAGQYRIGFDVTTDATSTNFNWKVFATPTAPTFPESAPGANARTDSTKGLKLSNMRISLKPSSGAAGADAALSGSGGSAANFITAPNDLTNSAWTKTGTPGVSYDGTQTTVTVPSGVTFQIYQQVAGVTGSTSTVSFYVEKVTAPAFEFGIQANGFAQWDINLTTGAVTTNTNGLPSTPAPTVAASGAGFNVTVHLTSPGATPLLAFYNGTGMASGNTLKFKNVSIVTP